MRFLISASLLVLTPVAFFVACGGSSDDGTNTQTVDSGTDATKDTGKADALENKDAETPAECTDADLATASIPDAALPGDGGATTATCATCARANCADGLSACNDNCDCKNALFGFYECQSQGKTFTACAGANLFGIKPPGDKIATSLGECVVDKCQKQCAVQ